MRLPRRASHRPSSLLLFFFFLLAFALATTFAAPDPLGVQAGDCLQLVNSSACPAFNNFFVDTTHLKDEYPWFVNVNDTASFDSTLTNYLRSTYFTTQYWQEVLKCSNITNKTPPYARYTTSVFCSYLLQNNNSLSCNFQNNLYPQPLCQITCSAWADSLSTISNQISLCGPLTDIRASALATEQKKCSTWDGLNGTTGMCVLGIVNEPNNCGFSNDTTQLCAFCNSTGNSTGNSTKLDSCCANIPLDKLCSAPIASSPHRFSVGEIAGIVVASLLFIGLIVLAVFCVVKKKDHGQPYSKPEMLGSISGYHSPSLNAYNSRATLSPLGRDSESDIVKYCNDNPFSTPAPGVMIPNKYFRVAHAYLPKMDDELHLHLNDVVQFIHSFDDGWALGINRSTNQKGAFPLVCIASISEDEADELLRAHKPDEISIHSIHDNENVSVLSPTKPYTQSPPPLDTPPHVDFPANHADTPKSPRHNAARNLTLTTTNLSQGPEPQPYAHNHLGYSSAIPNRQGSMRFSPAAGSMPPVSPASSLGAPGSPTSPSGSSPFRQPSRHRDASEGHPIDTVRFGGNLYRSENSDAVATGSGAVGAIGRALDPRSTMAESPGIGSPTSQTYLV